MLMLFEAKRINKVSKPFYSLQKTEQVRTDVFRVYIERSQVQLICKKPLIYLYIKITLSNARVRSLLEVCLERFCSTDNSVRI